MSNVALALDTPALGSAVPSTYRLGQVITAYAGPLLRLEGLDASASLSATMSSAEAVASVRAQGLRALSVDVPSAGSATPVSVRLYSLTGRLVRVLVDETVQPGSYVVGWDGEDAAGRPVQPGVYIAVMTAGRYRGVQRLLIK
jgi:flagellar hook assembly protein FlgD